MITLAARAMVEPVFGPYAIPSDVDWVAKSFLVKRVSEFLEFHDGKTRRKLTYRYYERPKLVACLERIARDSAPPESTFEAATHYGRFVRCFVPGLGRDPIIIVLRLKSPRRRVGRGEFRLWWLQIS